jgi:SAM-dependent methyltransferase
MPSDVSQNLARFRNPSRPATENSPARPVNWVRETRFGHWFLGTSIWSRYVVETALSELAALLPAEASRPRTILDAEVARTSRVASSCRCRVEVRQGDARALAQPDESVDMILCHQLLHHVVEQEAVLREFYRVLAPGGVLLVAESCRAFIASAPVRLLFRHPGEVQKTAAGYQQIVREAGFNFGPEHVTTSTPFWSLTDWGLRYKLGWKKNPAAEPTEVTFVAFKPAGGRR